MWGVGIRISKVAKTKIYNLVFCKMECTVVFNTSMEGFSQKKKKRYNSLNVYSLTLDFFFFWVSGGP